MARERFSIDRILVEGAYKCGTCLGSLIATIIVIIWLAMRPSEPKLYIAAFAAPSLNVATINATTSPAILFLVEINNVNDNFGIQYDNLNITVGVFLDRNMTSPIGNSIIEGFYQGRKKTAQKWSSVEAHAGALNRMAKIDGKTHFRVDFTTAVKYRTWFSYSKRHRLWGGANVAVNYEGLKDEIDNLRLGHYFPVILPSGALRLAAGSYRMLLLLGLFLHFVFLGLFL